MSLVTDFIKDVRECEDAGEEITPFSRGIFVGRSIGGTEEDYEDISAINRALAGINLYPLGDLDNRNWL